MVRLEKTATLVRTEGNLDVLVLVMAQREFAEDAHIIVVKAIASRPAQTGLPGARMFLKFLKTMGKVSWNRKPFQERLQEKTNEVWSRIDQIIEDTVLPALKAEGWQSETAEEAKMDISQVLGRIHN